MNKYEVSTHDGYTTIIEADSFFITNPQVDYSFGLHTKDNGIETIAAFPVPTVKSVIKIK